ncbi:copper homeostasis CutC domain-containing protein [Ilyonectria robusta]|uniref:copper homeostasis CutC domain-containing protein n=1 Tax=Ilyonectria robusta TaxID=1079257 RepID=UPI001E8D855F|nr:copper homeostasis CutC domain-containing protein [Ilyonectria robusta]KAH8733347.1 copper homeostasis CutC domain-containing protein [Ilyonectria robusta]
MVKKTPLEVAVFSPANALRAQALGAYRVELNAQGSYDDGGLTPLVSDVASLHRPEKMGDQKLEIPIRIMIRPRPAPGPTHAEPHDFVYSDAEFQTMWDSITAFKNLRTLNPVRGDAFVFGILERVGPGVTPVERELAIDIRRCTMLVAHAKPIRCVFHRAFDVIAKSDDWHDGLSELVRCGFTGVLTSGGDGPFYDNIDRIHRMCCQMPDLQIIVGGGVRYYNVEELLQRLDHIARLNIWMHSSCLSHDEPTDLDPEEVDPDELIGLCSALGLDDVD